MNHPIKILLSANRKLVQLNSYCGFRYFC